MMTLMFGVIFGAIGGVYIALGRRNHDPTYLVTGFLLIIYPYIFSSALAIIAVGLLLMAVPIARDRGWW
jgi:hypothetical protein